MPLHCVKIGYIDKVVFQLKWGRLYKLYRDLAAFNDRRLFVTLAFRNGLEYSNFDFNMLIGNYFCTLCINFAKFSYVIPKFKT